MHNGEILKHGWTNWMYLSTPSFVKLHFDLNTMKCLDEVKTKNPENCYLWWQTINSNNLYNRKRFLFKFGLRAKRPMQIYF